MLNIMDFEAIKHQAAQEVFNGTEYDWRNMLDNTEYFSKTIRNKSEEECYKAWKEFFIDSLEAERDADAHAINFD